MGNYNLTQTGPQVQDILDEAYIVPEDGIPTSDIADGAVTEPKIANAAVTKEKLAQAVQRLIEDGYVYKNIAAPIANPGTPTRKEFWIVPGLSGTFTHFGNITLIKRELALLKWNGNSWSYDHILYIDDAPKSNSDNLVSSGGVHSALQGKQNTIPDLSDIRSGASAGATAYQKPSEGIPESDLSTDVQASLGKADTAYQKPLGGIPESDLSTDVQASLDKADTAYQKPLGGIPETDLSTDVQTSLGKADTALQTETEPQFNASPAAGITQTDIDNWNEGNPPSVDLEINTSDFTNTPVVAQTGNWAGITSNQFGVVIPIKAGETYTASTSTGGILALLKSTNNMSTSGAVDFCADYPSRIAFNANDSLTFTAPSDANYLFLNKKSSSGFRNWQLIWHQVITDNVKETDALVGSLVAEKLGKNLYNKDSVTDDRFIGSSGAIQGNANYVVSDFIPVEEGETYCATGLDAGTPSAVGYSTIYVGYYDEHFNIISVTADNVTTFTIPTGIKYARFSVRKSLTDVQVEKGNSRTTYEPFSPIGGYPVIIPSNSVGYNNLDSSLQSSIDSISSYAQNEEAIENFFVGDGYVKGTCTGNKRPVVNITVASGAKAYYRINVTGTYSRLTLYVDDSNQVRIFDSNDSTLIQDEWVEFTAPQAMTFIGVYVTGFSGTITLEATITAPELEVIEDDIAALQQQIKPDQFGRLIASATLAPTEFVRTDAVQLDKDSLLSAHIVGTIQNFQVGVGKTPSGYTYYGHWLEIDTTNVKLYWYNNNTNVLLNTYAHGLTFTNDTSVVIESTINGNTKTTILRLSNDLGNVFEQSLPEWGVGAAFVLNGNTTGNLQAEISLMPRQLIRKVWLFGDSYVSFTSPERWPYYIANLGILDFFANNQPGLSPTSAYSALTTLLGLGFTPTYLVWTLGMNGVTTETQSGGVYVINSAQKQVIDDVVAICEEKGIIPVFGCVPTVPTRQKTGFCSYVRSLGYRYIDFAEAVGTDSSGNWNTGLLSSDGVHPTAAGAKVLAARVLVDFPEIALM